MKGAFVMTAPSQEENRDARDQTGDRQNQNLSLNPPLEHTDILRENLFDKRPLHLVGGVDTAMARMAPRTAGRRTAASV